MEPLVVAVLLATTNKTVVDYLIAPVRQRFPQADLWWVLYVALVTGFALGWFSEVNLFSEYIPNVEVGRVVSSVLIGGGSSLIHQVFKPSDPGEPAGAVG